MRVLRDINIPIKIAIYLISLLLLVWRLSDLVEEAAVGAIKMSMGPYEVSGNDAILTQVLIIVFLAFVVLIARKNILHAYPHSSQDS